MPYESVWLACAEVVVLLPRYAAGTLERHMLLVVADHLEACPGCDEALALLMLRPPDASPAADGAGVRR